jgi:hypothetical protein
MENIELINVIANGGAFALAAFLVIYVMRENSKREERTFALLDKYASELGKLSVTLELIESKIPDDMGRYKP